MPAEVNPVSGQSWNEESPQGATLGGNKPLHRFMKGQPRIVGIIVLIVGASSFVVSVSIKPYSHQAIYENFAQNFLLESLFIICGILYIVTDHNATKKTVTISLGLSIVTLLVVCWYILCTLPDVAHNYYLYSYFYEENSPETSNATAFPYSEVMGVTVEVIFLFHFTVGAVIFIIMSTLAGAALRSTKSQAVLIMTTTPTETPDERGTQEGS
ncbi:uncharacterized protein LOC113122053 [Mastacembelus armatus]|uniref:Uncharacterized LOC113122053 n=1 Tax=Mastacembelus armatus TaxID=205130 RepID=A0A3Q3MSY6_9TELE|nr:uncharacterized protein LOC113122053 [Mastacembelus armatus]